MGISSLRIWRKGNACSAGWSLAVTVMVDAGLGQLSTLSLWHSPALWLICFMVKTGRCFSPWIAVQCFAVSSGVH